MARFAKYFNLTKILSRRVQQLFFAALIIALVYSRFVNLTWGFPFLMHPDENNMISSVMQLHCSLKDVSDCLNPHFFAYGQLMLYLASMLSLLIEGLIQAQSLSPLVVSLSLRLLSAFSSVAAGLLLFNLIRKKMQDSWVPYLGLLLYIFTPALIQQSHFGTTEGLLTLLLLLTVSAEHDLLLQSLYVGLAIAVKPSGALFAIVPLLTLLEFLKKTKNIYHVFFRGLLTIVMTVMISLIFSPHYFINWKYFLSTFLYESAVANGAVHVFYTQQFNGTVPILFQLQKILPYAAGWVLMLFGALGLVMNFKKFPKLVITFLFLFIYSAFLYAKWSRFIIPFLPILIFLSVLTITRLYDFLCSCKLRTIARILLVFIILYQVILGMSFLSIYTSLDVRKQATNWFIHAMPKNSKVFSESANVVDIPLGYTNEYVYTNPFINDIDTNHELQKLVTTALDTTDYVVIPSRRVFADYTCFKLFTPEPSKDRNCLQESLRYPALEAYYRKLFDKNKFHLIAEFSSFPKLQLFGKTIMEFPDESAEETWTVFDHPVIRIYQREKQRL